MIGIKLKDYKRCNEVVDIKHCSLDCLWPSWIHYVRFSCTLSQWNKLINRLIFEESKKFPSNFPLNTCNITRVEIFNNCQVLNKLDKPKFAYSELETRNLMYHMRAFHLRCGTRVSHVTTFSVMTSSVITFLITTSSVITFYVTTFYVVKLLNDVLCHDVLCYDFFCHYISCHHFLSHDFLCNDVSRHDFFCITILITTFKLLFFMLWRFMSCPILSCHFMSRLKSA